MVTDNYVVKRIEMLQEELDSLKRTVHKALKRKKVKIRGIWKGIDISDEEIDKAKTSWLKSF